MLALLTYFHQNNLKLLFPPRFIQVLSKPQITLERKLKAVCLQHGNTYMQKKKKKSTHDFNKVTYSMNKPRPES